MTPRALQVVSFNPAEPFNIRGKCYHARSQKQLAESCRSCHVLHHCLHCLCSILFRLIEIHNQCYKNKPLNFTLAWTHFFPKRLTPVRTVSSCIKRHQALVFPFLYDLLLLVTIPNPVYLPSFSSQDLILRPSRILHLLSSLQFP